MDKQTKEKIQAAMSKLNCTIDSVSFQARCIEAHNFYAQDGDEIPEELKHESTGELLTLEDMWDNNDSDNWTSMESNLNDVLELLKELVKE